MPSAGADQRHSLRWCPPAWNSNTGVRGPYGASQVSGPSGLEKTSHYHKGLCPLYATCLCTLSSALGARLTGPIPRAVVRQAGAAEPPVGGD